MKINRLMGKIVNFNDCLIEEKYGNVNRNLDWGVDSNDKEVSVCSKIYLNEGVKYLKVNGKIGDKEEDFVVKWMDK